MRRAIEKPKKRINAYLVFYLIIIVFAFINYTFSKYTVTTETASRAEIAKFQIAVNGTEVKQSEQQENFDLTLDKKLVPDSSGYFEVAINPDGTQVNLEYELDFDLTEINAENNRNIVLTEYSLDGGTTKTAISDNKISGEITLDENASGFTDQDTITARVYWEWNQDITNPTFENTTIQTTALIKQKITDGSENV